MVKWFKGSRCLIGVRVQLIHQFKGSIGKKGSIGAQVQLSQGLKLFEGSFVSRVQLVQGFNWFKDSISSRVQLFQGSNWFKG